MLRLLIAFSLTAWCIASPPLVRRVVAMEYPDLAIQARMQGEILVEGTVDGRGGVIDAKVINAVGMTDQGQSILG